MSNLPSPALPVLQTFWATSTTLSTALHRRPLSDFPDAWQEVDVVPLAAVDPDVAFLRLQPKTWLTVGAFDTDVVRALWSSSNLPPDE